MAYSIGDYPLPAYAAYIWIDGDNIRIGLPPIEGNERGHSVKISVDKCQLETNENGQIKTTQLGWKAILDILHSRVRDHASKQEFNRLARKSSPLQYQIDQWVKSGGIKKFTEEGHQVLSDQDLEELFEG